jgi:uncharacterized membrane protein
MNRKQIFLVAIILAIAPVAYLYYSWPQLPATVPLHFGIDGKPDRFGDKTELITGMAVMTLVGFGCFLLLMNIHKIDPKKARNSPAVMAKIALAVLLLISLIQFMIVDSAHTGKIKFDQFFLPLLGLFFAFLGNVFYSVKPNYFVGIRTPWALENEENWRRTHQLAGKVWFAGGLLAMLLTLFLPFHIATFVFMGITFIMVIIPLVFSYRFYKHQQMSR